MAYNNNNTYNLTQAPRQNQSYGHQKSDNEISIPSFNLKVLSKELFDKVADECAYKIKQNKKSNKPSQLRRFYDELVLWDERASISEEAFENALPFIFMIKSKVAYAVGRRNVDKTFKKFMDNVIDQIDSIKTLKNAKLFMEAMLGFYKSYRPNDND